MFNGPIDIPKTIPDNNLNNFYYLRGALAGRILYLGPTYSETVSSHKANKSWKTSFLKLASKTTEGGRPLSDFREDEAEYSKLILEWDETHIEKIQKIDSRISFGFRWSAEDGDILLPELEELSLGGNKADGSAGEGAQVNDSLEPRRFFAENSRIGFAPQGTRVGDLVYHFWDCDVAVILRPLGDEKNDRWRIIGKADLSQRELREKWAQKIDEQALNFGEFACLLCLFFRDTVTDFSCFRNCRC